MLGAKANTTNYNVLFSAWSKENVINYFGTISVRVRLEPTTDSAKVSKRAAGEEKGTQRTKSCCRDARCAAITVSALCLEIIRKYFGQQADKAPEYVNIPDIIHHRHPLNCCAAKAIQ